MAIQVSDLNANTASIQQVDPEHGDALDQLVMFPEVLLRRHAAGAGPDLMPLSGHFVPDGVGAKLLQIVQFLSQTSKIANAIAIAVIKRPHMDLINDCIFVPLRVLRQCQATFSLRAAVSIIEAP